MINMWYKWYLSYRRRIYCYLFHRLLVYCGAKIISV